MSIIQEANLKRAEAPDHISKTKSSSIRPRGTTPNAAVIGASDYLRFLVVPEIRLNYVLEGKVSRSVSAEVIATPAVTGIQRTLIILVRLNGIKNPLFSFAATFVNNKETFKV